MSISQKLMSVQKADDAVYSADLTNASPDNVSLNLATNNINSPRGLAFNSDGSELVVVCSETDKFHTYSLSNNYLLTGTVTYLGTSRTLSTGRAIPLGMCFGKNGERLYTTDGADKVCEHHIPSSDAYDVAEGTYQGTGQDYDTSGYESGPAGIAFNNDGTKMYIGGGSSDQIIEVALSTAWDVSTGTTNTAGQNSIVTLDVSSEDTSPSGIAFNSNGTKLYVLGRINDDVFQYGLTTAYDLSTASYDNISYSPPSSANDNNWYGIAFNPTYTKMFLTGRTEDKVQQFSCD